MATATLSSEGFTIVQGVLARHECETVATDVANTVTSGAGSRHLLSLGWCQSLAVRLRAHPGLAKVLPPHYVATQCTYFSKSAACNWLVPIHQDLSIPVAERIHAPALRGWSEKQGELFVQAPADVLESLVAVRVHLDACGEADGPLQVVPGSHAYGMMTPEAAAKVRDLRRTVACTMNLGDVLVMRPLLLHASSKSSGSSMRRVLHFLFGPSELPFGLRWQYAV